MSSEPFRCQSDTIFSGSYPVSWVTINSRKLVWYLSNRGFVPTIQKLTSILKRVLLPQWLISRPVNKRNAHLRCAPLNLQPGEVVEVKSEREITESLDADRATSGLAFMDPMRSYCGKRMRVYKRVNHILCEFGGGERKLKDTVLLEGAICDGREQACDRACFFFWREAWLRRVTDETPSATGPSQASTQNITLESGDST